LRLVWWN